jgi:hypothetical protein
MAQTLSPGHGTILASETDPTGARPGRQRGTVMADKKITPKQPSGASAANAAAAGVTKTSAKKLGHKKLGHKKLGHKKLGH